MSEMDITPSHVSVGSLFHESLIFNVPKYQRGYAWGDAEISDFLKDISEAYDARINDNPKTHFFGGIVSVRKAIPGAAHEEKCELVDGQQRIATFVILMAKVTKVYQNLLDEEEIPEDREEIIKKRIEDLKKSYFQIDIDIHRKVEKFYKLKLSKADKDEFHNLLYGRDITIKRDSHKKLKQAFISIEEWVDNLIEDCGDLSEKLDVLESIKKIIDEDLSIIHIVTTDKKDAIKLFQVLNNRGISLTEGDLLRARTLELLESDEFMDQQDSIEKAWDEILKDAPSDTEDYLRWIYASYEGTRAGKSTLFDDFLEAFYPEDDMDEIEEQDANQIVDTTLELQKEFEKCRKVSKGNWPYEELGNPITDWDIDRLNTLTNELNHTNCIPVLLAASRLSQTDFLDIVKLTERIFFRYKLVCNEHITSLNNIYNKEAENIRDSIEDYEVDSYKTALNNLQERKTHDEKFTNQLEELLYQTSSGNKNVKYCLMTLNYYLDWFGDGSDGEPICHDKTTVYDFSNTTVEHIYPRNAEEDDKNETLEEVKHKLGNLTVLAPRDNKAAENATFNDKQEVFEQSNIALSRKLTEYDEWEIEDFQNRHDDIKDMCLSVFTIDSPS
ncbi:DUF262 domain-containing protein [Fodinibius sp. AD559]|uniref:DUF262 domain-containing protein n=1 Tax=Fodinibius sp. AD559 TaxID=3424179 RepID=UPI004046D44A